MGLLDSYGRQDSKRQLTIDQKLEAIRRVTDLGETKASVSRMYGVPESTLRGWCKNKDKLLFLSMNKQRDPKRKPDKHIAHYEGLLMPVRSQEVPESKKVKLEVEMTGFQEPQNCDEVTPPLAHSNTQPPQTSPVAYDLPRLFAMYCAQAGTQAMDINPDEPLSLVKRDHDSPPSSPASDGSHSLFSVPDDDTLEAIQHGEQFLRWVHTCAPHMPAPIVVGVGMFAVLTHILDPPFPSNLRRSYRVPPELSGVVARGGLRPFHHPPPAPPVSLPPRKGQNRLIHAKTKI